MSTNNLSLSQDPSLMLENIDSMIKTISSHRVVPKKRWVRSRKSSKIRIKLPSVEEYQKDPEFTVDAPARVIVRLERLMGTDKIKIMNPRYMKTLLQRIQQEEEATWLKRTNERKEEERSRFRRLAVEGIMEPTSDMKDLYDHPVFRVNRILNRLAKIDYTLMAVTNAKPLPPIIPVEPFAEESNGYFNRPSSNVDPNWKCDDVKENSKLKDDLEQHHEKNVEKMANAVNNLIQRKDNDGNQEEEKLNEEWGGEDYDVLYPEFPGKNKDDALLYSTMTRFGISQTVDLEKKCKPFRSKLIDQVYDENLGKSNQIFGLAEEILGAYRREQLTADEFVAKMLK